jgi:hypothetical protein
MASHQRVHPRPDNSATVRVLAVVVAALAVILMAFVAGNVLAASLG